MVRPVGPVSELEFLPGFVLQDRAAASAAAVDSGGLFASLPGDLRGSGEILRKHHLQAVFSGAEPMWLPEAVYEAHPEWRGPRCQYPPRAKNNYYAPCIDRPEVLAMYRQSVADLCRLVPVEEFDFLANDSGSGICWHPGLYPGVNGPDFCKGRPMNERLDGWMKAVATGAADAGLTADVTIDKRSLTPDAKPRKRLAAGPACYFYWSNTFPVVGVPQPCAFAQQLETIFASPDTDCRINIESIDSTSLFDLVREFRQRPAQACWRRFKFSPTWLPAKPERTADRIVARLGMHRTRRGGHRADPRRRPDPHARQHQPAPGWCARWCRFRSN